MKAIVAFEGGLAHYDVSPEDSGIYQARLFRYEGQTENCPPKELILVRGVRHWSGSSDKQVLLDELGKAIEKRERLGEPNNK